MQMADTDDPALWYALNRLITNYWADVDVNGGSQAHEFYLPEALYAVGNNRFEGVDKIRAFYDRRRHAGGLPSRVNINLDCRWHFVTRFARAGVRDRLPARTDGRG
jgi:hypothetical protein